MNPRRFLASLLVATIVPLTLSGAPDIEQLQLQPRLYVFKNSDFRTVGVDAPSSATAGQSRVFRGPTTMHFDEHTLTLRGESFVWSTGESAPASIGLIAAPTIRVDYGQTATLRCVARTQYAEKRPDGTFELHEIGPDSPDVPRYLLSFVVEPGRRAGDGLRVTCRPEFVSIREREKIPGIELDLGRPRMARFQDVIQFNQNPNEWVALLFRSPAENDYSVLALFRIVTGVATPVQPSSEAGGTSGADTMNVLVAAQRTEAGRNAPTPSPEIPVPYIAYDGGLFEAGLPLAGAKLPSAGEVGAAFRASVEARGYVPATAQNPPSVVLIYHWGSVRNELNHGLFSMLHGSGEQFLYVSAYDYRALQQREAVLLWHLVLGTREEGSLATTLLALAGVCGPYLGLDLEVPRFAAPNIPRGSPQPVATGSSSAIPRETAAILDGETIQLIAKQEHRFLDNGGLTRSHRGAYFALKGWVSFPFMPSIPARAKDTPRTERDGPTLKLQASARIVPGESSTPLPTLEHPVPVLAYDGGLFETGDLVAGTKYPSAADMSAAFGVAFTAAGFVPATAQRPPAIVLVCHWGYDRKQRDAVGPYRKEFSVPVVLRSTIYVSAYDFAALQRREKTLLWRVALVTDDPAPFTQLFPALARACAPYLGRSFEGIVEDTAPLAPARSTTGAQSFTLPSEIVAGLDQEVIRTLVEQEHRFLEGGGRLHVDEKPGTSLIPVGK